MRIVLLGAGGLMARATARDLLESSPGIELVLADLDRGAAQRVADGLMDAAPSAAQGIHVRAVDAGDVDSVRAVIAGADACINSAVYYVNVAVMHAALLERVPYVDLGGLFHVTREQLLLGADFEAAGVTAIIGMGSTPGVTNVQARASVARLDRVETLEIYCGNTPNADFAGSWGYSINTILDELSKAPVTFRDGAFLELEPLAEPERFAFLPPIGEKEVHHSLHSEIATLPLSFAAAGLRHCFFKLDYFGFTPRALRDLKTMVDAGFGSTSVVAVPDRSRPGSVVSIRIRDALIGTLAHEAERRAAAATAALGGDHVADDGFVIDHEEVCVVATGTLDGRTERVRIDTIATGRPDWKLAGGTLLTATPPGIVATWLADGTVRAPGVHPPETTIDPDLLFAELERRGMHTTIDGGRPD